MGRNAPKSRSWKPPVEKDRRAPKRVQKQVVDKVPKLGRSVNDMLRMRKSAGFITKAKQERRERSGM